VPAELKWLRDNNLAVENMLIISANEHAIHAGLKPHYACVNDDVHSMLGVHQAPRMRQLMPDTLLLSRHWWADYRSPQLLACNSGLKALLYAALLGANPIIAVGFDHYRSSDLYFHDTEVCTRANPNQSRELSHFTKQTNAIMELLRGVPVRAVGGPLVNVWQRVDPQELFTPRELGQLERDIQKEASEPRYVCVTEPAFTFEGSLVPKGAIFAVTEREREGLLMCNGIVDATDWDLTDKDSAHLKFMQAQLAEQQRRFQLIEQVRKAPRSLVRGLYDADLIRIIEWTAQGQTPEVIAGNTGWPKQQVAYVVKTMGLDIPVGAVLPCSLKIDTSARGLASVPGESGGATAVVSGEPE
jgi:hypothetical protein